MFIVKAELKSDVGPTPYQLYDAQAVRVEPCRMAQSHGPSPDLEVQLTDIDGRILKTLYVGTGLDHYCCVYIMNAQGKTIDSVWPGPSALERRVA